MAGVIFCILQMSLAQRRKITCLGPTGRKWENQAVNNSRAMHHTYLVPASLLSSLLYNLRSSPQAYQVGSINIPTLLIRKQSDREEDNKLRSVYYANPYFQLFIP